MRHPEGLGKLGDMTETKSYLVLSKKYSPICRQRGIVDVSALSILSPSPPIIKSEPLRYSVRLLQSTFQPWVDSIQQGERNFQDYKTSCMRRRRPWILKYDCQFFWRRFTPHQAVLSCVRGRVRPRSWLAEPLTSHGSPRRFQSGASYSQGIRYGTYEAVLFQGNQCRQCIPLNVGLLFDHRIR